jgi:hypothetical protein
MRVLPALVLGYFAVVAGGPEGNSNEPALENGMTGPALAEIDEALGLAMAPSAPSFEPKLDEARRIVTPSGRVVSLPNGCRAASRPYDLLIHFHGAPPVMESAFERSGIDGVLAVVNLGLGSGKYETAFQAPGSYDVFVATLAQVVKQLCPGSASRPARVALSGWSAGYGAVQRILERPADAAKIDSVLLADGLHARFEPGAERFRMVFGPQMAPFAAFADEAVLGRRLFAVTHSSIATPYASTTETADYLLSLEGMKRKSEGVAGPRPGMTLLSSSHSGGFHVLGYDGMNEAAHCDHLHGFGDILMPYLRERWSMPQQAGERTASL